MAATIAKAQGFRTDGRAQNNQATRLGSGEAMAQANTCETFTCAYIRADGAGYVTVERNGKEIHRFEFGPE